MKNARRKLGVPMPAAMPCTTPINSGGETICGVGRSHLCKRNKFIESLHFVSQVYPDASGIKYSGCKDGSGERIGKLENTPAWQLTKVRNKKEVIDEARTKEECKKKLGNTSGSRYALQDKQEQSAWSDPW